MVARLICLLRIALFESVDGLTKDFGRDVGVGAVLLQQLDDVFHQFDVVGVGKHDTHFLSEL